MEIKSYNLIDSKTIYIGFLPIVTRKRGALYASVKVGMEKYEGQTKVFRRWYDTLCRGNGDADRHAQINTGHYRRGMERQRHGGTFYKNHRRYCFGYFFAFRRTVRGDLFF